MSNNTLQQVLETFYRELIRLDLQTLENVCEDGVFTLSQVDTILSRFVELREQLDKTISDLQHLHREDIESWVRENVSRIRAVRDIEQVRKILNSILEELNEQSP